MTKEKRNKKQGINQAISAERIKSHGVSQKGGPAGGMVKKGGMKTGIRIERRSERERPRPRRGVNVNVKVIDEKSGRRAEDKIRIR